jgi:hypothetical protein
MFWLSISRGLYVDLKIASRLKYTRDLERRPIQARGDEAIGFKLFKWKWDQLYIKYLISHVIYNKHYDHFTISGLSARDARRLTSKINGRSEATLLFPLSQSN